MGRSPQYSGKSAAVMYRSAVCMFLICISISVVAAESRSDTAAPQAKPYSPYAGNSYPSRPFFGDTHLHTSFSMDAGASGARLSPEDAYRFARGEELTSNTGQPVKLSRPLDFLVVADHSDGMGFFPLLMSGSPEVLADPQASQWLQWIKQGEGQKAALAIVGAFGAGTISKELMPVPGSRIFSDTWAKTIAAADAHNDPGTFTAFIGFEWTSNTGAMNLHRNVIFRGDGRSASQVVPYVTQAPYGSDNPVDLWKWMAAYEQKTGDRLLAIAHNGNLSNGTMFPVVEAFGKTLDLAYVEERAKWERLYEATQTKGDGEAHPFLSPNDEFADFETWDKGNLDLSAPKEDSMLEFEYVRSAYKNGLKLELALGTNPYKFGLVGSSDAHTGLAAMEEDNFFGKIAPMEPGPERMTNTFMHNAKNNLTIKDHEVSASGYAAVWATENTREAIWEAMERKETYATTGTRLVVRFFGGWDFTAADASNRHPAEAGYARGVPMGGDLSAAPSGKAPTFLVAASKDPMGANLDRIQIIKGWLDATGTLHEKVYDVAWGDADKRQPGADGKLPSVGSTVDIAAASWTNTIGDSDLATAWTDPDFDAAQRAFYYVRVLEIPTPRWTAYDARQFSIAPEAGTAMTLQERAYTSAIWYTP